jgi:hypothetical protein
MPDVTDPTAPAPDQAPAGAPATAPAPAPTVATKSGNINPITSLESAQSVARLIKDGKITGPGKDRAIADLRAFHNSVEYEKKPHGDVKNPVERMGTMEKLARGFGEGATSVGRGIRQLASEAGETARDSDVGQGISKALAPLTGGVGVAQDKDNSDDLRAQEDQIRASKSRQALLDTKAGKLGNFAGQAAATAPAALIPGAGTVGGAALVGGALGGANPVGTNESRAGNVVSGAVGGVAGKYLGEGASALASKAASKLFPNASMNSLISRLPKGVKPEAARALQNNYKLPPSMAKRAPNAVEDIAEGVGGKIRNEQRMSIDNQINSNRMGRRAIGMRDEGTETENLITKGDLSGVRAKAGEAHAQIRALPIEAFSPRSRAYYGDAYFRGETKLNPTESYKKSIGALGKRIDKYAKDFPAIFKNDKAAAVIKDLKKPMSTDDMVELSNKLRGQASVNYRSTNSDKVDLAKIQKKAAQSIDDLLETHLKDLKSAATSPEAKQMFDKMIESRKTIARTYDIQSALTRGGNIDAVKMARVADKRPLSGELAEIAHFGSYFPGAARDPTRIGSRLGPNVSKTEIGAGVISSFVNPTKGWKSAVKEVALVAAPAAARKGLISNAYQHTLKPKVTSVAREQIGNTLKRAGVVGGPIATNGLTLSGNEEEQQQ